MALDFSAGFDTYSSDALAALDAWNTVNTGANPGSASWGTSGRIDGKCLSLSQSLANSSVGRAKFFVGGALSTAYVGFAFNLDGIPASAATCIGQIRAGTTATCQIFVTPSGHIQIQTSGGTVIATGTATIVSGAYFMIEIKIEIAGASGAVTTQVNGSADIARTTGNFGSTNVDNIRLLADLLSGSRTTKFDDVYVHTSAFLGDVHAETVFPSGAGGHTQWTPDSGSNYARVNESSGTFPDGDTSYVADSSVNDIDTYVFTDLAIASGTIYGVSVLLTARKTDAGARTIAAVTRRGGTDSVAADIVLSTSYVTYRTLLTQDPNAGPSDWTVTNFNATEFGPKVTT